MSIIHRLYFTSYITSVKQLYPNFLCYLLSNYFLNTLCDSIQFYVKKIMCSVNTLSVPKSNMNAKEHSARFDDEEPEQDTVSKIKLKLEDIQYAHNRIKTQIVQTPLVEAKFVGSNFCNVFFKCENLQISGSFKARGTCNVLSSMTPGERSKGCTISGGRNFLLAMAHYGLKESVPVTLVIPRDCPIADRQRYKESFAIMKVNGNDSNDAGLHALAFCESTGSNFVRSSERLDLLAGYGTVGLEILGQMDSLDAIICPVGTGGLVASILLAVKTLKPNCLIYGVESSIMPTMTKALQENKPVLISMKPSIADSLAEVIASTNAFNIIRGFLDRMIMVDETWISRAVVSIFDREKIVVEPAAACPVAAIMAGKVPELRGKRVVCILSGGNVNMSRLPHLIERGMLAEGRLLTFCATLHDSPGALAKLLAKVADIGADIRSFVPERKDVLSITVKVLIEPSNTNQAKELEKKLLKDYPLSQISY